MKVADSNGKSDPYCKVLCNGTKSKTKTIKETLNPSWDHVIPIKYSDNKVNLQIKIWDWDLIGFDDFLGEANANLDVGAGVYWLTLQPRKHKKDKGIQGEVCVEIRNNSQ